MSDEAVTQEEWFAYLRTLTPGQRLAVRMEEKAIAKKTTKLALLKAGLLRRGSTGKRKR